jgi:ABC-2 type transport system ATP-binding protein
MTANEHRRNHRATTKQERSPAPVPDGGRSTRTEPTPKDRRARKPERVMSPHAVDPGAVDTSASTPRGAVVRAVSLTKRYGELAAVDDVTFSLQSGTVTGFLGPNGAGKTTTLRLLLGLAQPTSGHAVVFDQLYRDLDHPSRRVGALLESNDFHPSRRGRDHLRVLALAAQIPPGRVDEVLDLVELGAAANRPVKTYSLGMRQRLGLAGALLGNPELLVLDEPANGLDPAGVNWLRTFLRRFADNGGTVLVSSHGLAEVAQTVDHVIVLASGRVVAAAPLDELTSNARTLEDVYLDLTEGHRS